MDVSSREGCGCCAREATIVAAVPRDGVEQKEGTKDPSLALSLSLSRFGHGRYIESKSNTGDSRVIVSRLTKRVRVRVRVSEGEREKEKEKEEEREREKVREIIE